MFDATPDEWEVRPLKEVAVHISRGSAPSYAADETGIWAVSQKCVRDGSFDLHQCRPHNGVKPVREAAYLRAGDICINSTGTGTLGRVALWQSAEGKYFADTHITVVRVIPNKADPAFLAAFLGMPSTCDAIYRECVTGSTNQIELSKTALGELACPFPPLDEQRRIATILRSVDGAIAAGRAAADQAKEARAHQLETLMALPGPMRPIEDVCRLSGGFGFPIKFQGKRKGAYPFAKVSDMNRPGNEVELVDAENYVDEDDLRLLKAKTFPAGTTLFPKVGAALLTNKRRIAARELIVDNNVMGAVATSIDPWFLFYAFSTIDMGDYVQPGAVPSVNQRTIGKIMIPVPTAELQREFVGTLRDFDCAIESQLSAMTRLVASKKSLAADLLSGRVRVPA